MHLPRFSEPALFVAHHQQNRLAGIVHRPVINRALEMRAGNEALETVAESQKPCLVHLIKRNGKHRTHGGTHSFKRKRVRRVTDQNDARHADGICRADDGAEISRNRAPGRAPARPCLFQA